MPANSTRLWELCYQLGCQRLISAGSRQLWVALAAASSGAGGEGRLQTPECPDTAGQPLLSSLSLSGPDPYVCLDEDVSYSSCGWITRVIKGARARLPRTFSRRQGGEKPGLIIQEMK